MDKINECESSSARSKVMSNWQSSWKCVALTTTPKLVNRSTDIIDRNSIEKSSDVRNGVTQEINENSDDLNVKQITNNGLTDVKPEIKIEKSGTDKKTKPRKERKDKKERMEKKTQKSDKKPRLKQNKSHRSHNGRPNGAPNGAQSMTQNLRQTAFQSQFNEFIRAPAPPPVAQTGASDVMTKQLNVFNAKQYNPKPKSESQIMAKKKVKQSLNNNKIKIRRNKSKPLIIKEFSSQKSFMSFCDQKFPPIKEGVPFIQDRSCKDFAKDFEASNLTYCLDCNDKRSDSQTCRFYQYRTLIKRNGQLSVYAFAEEGNANAEDCKTWLPFPTKSLLDTETAKYLLTFVGQDLCELYRSEREIWEQFVSVTWKKPVKGIRELCDVCQTTIFNTHYVCPKCGFAVCVDCFQWRKTQPKPTPDSRRKNHDEFGWIFCKDKQNHVLNDFHLAIIITKAVFGSIDTTLHLTRNQLEVMGVCGCGRLDSSIIVDIRQMCSNLFLPDRYSHVPQQWLCDNRLLVLTDPKCGHNLKIFQMHWLRGFPVMIQSVHKTLHPTLWSPQNFGKHFGKQTSRLVNCRNGSIIPKRPMSDFWDGFEDIEKRLTDEVGDEMILKLKDWPPNAEYREKLPLWFDDLMDALPLKEYTRWDGNRNLASRLPEFFVRPDLGPKMYCAYGSALHPDKGTTNLHLDMSDAVNVMIYVGVARQHNQPLQSHLNEANRTLLKGGCDQQMMDRVNTEGLKVGALWHIWRAEDAGEMRVFLRKVAKERHKRNDPNTDPIHDQSWYLDETLRKRLEVEHNVRGMAIAQCLGDSILVPAGAPHQVQNIHSCIKVAGEFVSPENVAHCLSLTHEFRRLSKRHDNHEDKLQIKNIIYHTVKDALAALLPHIQPMSFALPTPPKLVVESTPPLSPIPTQSQSILSPNLSVSQNIFNFSNCCQSVTPSVPMETAILLTPPNSIDETVVPLIVTTPVATFASTLTSADTSTPTHADIESIALPMECLESEMSAIPLTITKSQVVQMPDLSLPPALSSITPNHQSCPNTSAHILSPPILHPFSDSDESNHNSRVVSLNSNSPNESNVSMHSSPTIGDLIDSSIKLFH